MRNKELTVMMNGAIGRLVKNATKIALSDFSSVPILVTILKRQNAAGVLRKKNDERGIHVPPFMIASIASACNLRCTGCYDRAKHETSGGVFPVSSSEHRELDAPAWIRIFGEARELGVSFILLAGGEPLLRSDVVRSCEKFPEIVFPVFTNGLLIDDGWLDFFSTARNVIPVLSLEGDEALTDKRRGMGVFASLSEKLSSLNNRKILYGVSITLTSENFDRVLSGEYVEGLVSHGAHVFFFVEYVPFDVTTESLVVTAGQKTELPARMEKLRERFPAVFLDFPGDEGAFGGCLASGRGFVHINARGNVESCPFAPYSDSSVAEQALSDALESPLLARIRSLQEGLDHTGGCALFENRAKVEKLL